MSIFVKIAGIVKESIVDGPGIRFCIYAQGCRHNCLGCHNPQTHPFDGGNLKNVDSIIEMVKKNPLLDGITLSGGEPFEQAEAFAELARRVHDIKLDVITYTGYTYEEIIRDCKIKKGWESLLNETDYLVDGPFEINKKNPLLKFRGSENQRIIDVKASKRNGQIVLVED